MCRCTSGSTSVRKSFTFHRPPATIRVQSCSVRSLVNVISRFSPFFLSNLIQFFDLALFTLCVFYSHLTNFFHFSVKRFKVTFKSLIFRFSNKKKNKLRFSFNIWFGQSAVNFSISLIFYFVWPITNAISSVNFKKKKERKKSNHILERVFCLLSAEQVFCRTINRFQY